MMMEFPRGLSALTGLNSLILNQTRTRFGEKGNGDNNLLRAFRPWSFIIDSYLV